MVFGATGFADFWIYALFPVFFFSLVMLVLDLGRRVLISVKKC